MKKGGNNPSAQRVPNSNPNKSLISTNALRTKAMYSNCVMQAPDGQVLCVCDAKKAQWYCEKELAGWFLILLKRCIVLIVECVVVLNKIAFILISPYISLHYYFY